MLSVNTVKCHSESVTEKQNVLRVCIYCNGTKGLHSTLNQNHSDDSVDAVNSTTSSNPESRRPTAKNKT